MQQLTQKNSASKESEIIPELDYSMPRNIGRFTKLFGIIALSTILTGCELQNRKVEEKFRQEAKEQKVKELPQFLPADFEVVEDITPYEKQYALTPYVAAYVRDTKRDICFYLQDNSRFNNPVMTTVPCEKLKGKTPDGQNSQPEKQSSDQPE